MRYLVFTDCPHIKNAFLQSGYHPLEVYASHLLRDTCRSIRGAVVYLDRSCDSPENFQKHLSYIKNRADLRFAIIDSNDSVNDPALFFHNGAVDFIGSQLLTEGLCHSRLEQVQRFKPIDSRFIHNDFDESVPYSGSSWDNVEEGREFIFGMLYAGLDGMGEMADFFGQEGADKFTSEFRSWLNEHMDGWYGYQWLWNEWGGVYLFPFDGVNFYAMEAAMECFLNRRISRFSNYERKTTFRFILHLGSTTFYKRGKTGNIISDSINSLFHMANRAGSKDELVISQEVKSLIPETLLTYLGSSEEFEGRILYKFKDFL